MKEFSGRKRERGRERERESAREGERDRERPVCVNHNGCTRATRTALNVQCMYGVVVVWVVVVWVVVVW